MTQKKITIFLNKFLIFLLGERITYRLGRSIYMHSRGDIPNDIAYNGEKLVQYSVIKEIANNSDFSCFNIFDVGANVGDWTNLFLSQLKEVSFDGNIDIFVFEPVPSTIATLRQNLPHNSHFIHIQEVALSSSPGKSDIYVSGKNLGINSLHQDDSNIQKEVIQISLDSVFNFCLSRKINHIHLLKSDTEGHDMEVIRGAIPLLSEGRISILQFEYNHRWIFSHNFLRDVFLLVEGMPYKVAKLQEHCLLIFKNWNPELDRFFEGNYALIHDDALGWFPTKYADFDCSNSLRIT